MLPARQRLQLWRRVQHLFIRLLSHLSLFSFTTSSYFVKKHTIQHHEQVQEALQRKLQRIQALRAYADHQSL